MRQLALDPFTFEEFEKCILSLTTHYSGKGGHMKTQCRQFIRHGGGFRLITPISKKFPHSDVTPAEPGTFGFTYLSYIKKLIQQGRLGTAISYHCSYNSLMTFRSNIRFTNITVNFLYQYEQWTKDRGIAKATQGIYLRNLRAIFNEAIADGIISKEKCYPFGRRKYQIPTGRNIKKALKLEQIEKIYFY